MIRTNTLRLPLRQWCPMPSVCKPCASVTVSASARRCLKQHPCKIKSVIKVLSVIKAYPKSSHVGCHFRRSRVSAIEWLSLSVYAFRIQFRAINNFFILSCVSSLRALASQSSPVFACPESWRQSFLQHFSGHSRRRLSSSYRWHRGRGAVSVGTGF